MMLIALGLLAAQITENPPDRITLTSGKELEGVILRIDDEILHLGEGTRNETIKLKKVDSYEGPRVAYFKDYIQRLEYVYSEQAGAADAIALANWCNDAGLKRSVPMHLWRALVLDPTSKEAHERLGHRQRGSDDTWEHRTETGSWLDLVELQEKRMSIRDPWVFRTTHFDVEAGGPLKNVLYACATMEAVYYRFYVTLQEHGEFFELRNIVKVRIYPSREEDYPEISPTVAGYYDKSTYLVHMFFDGPHVKNLIRVTCHAVFERTAHELTRSPPTLAGWLYEGFASYFEGGFEVSEGVPVWWNERIRDVDFRRHYAAEDVYEADRVTGFVDTDFDARSDADLAYAQSYTLLYYMLHAAPEDMQKGFLAYLPGAWESRGTNTHLKKAIGRREWKKVDEGWAEFVKETVQQMK